MQIIDIFSGIGGFSLSGSWLGWRTVQFCEIDNYCQRILNKHWTDVPIHTDIKTLTADQIINNGLYDKKETTIITGGVPCQPWSNTGKRQGEADIRNLWPETINLIGSIRPDFAVLENVPGLLTWNKGLFFENICTSLENEGYEIWPFIIPSASCGAWDKRERVWIIAYNHKFRCNNEQEKQREVISNEIRDNAIEKQNRGKQQCGIMQSDFIPADITEQRIGELSIQQRGQNETGHADVDGEIKINPDINKFNSDNAGYNSGTISQQQTSGIQINNDINGKGLQGHTWYELTKGQKDTIRRNGQANWLRDWIEVASELCRSNARVPHRMDRIKALGNSVNPYVVYQIFKAIEQYENSLKTE